MRFSIRPVITAALMSLVLVAPAHAQFGGASVPGLGGGGGGGNFGATAKTYTANVVTGMLNTVRGVENVQQALGKKQEAERLEAIAKEIEQMKTPSSDTIEKASAAVASDPIDRTALTNVKSAEGKKLLANATANMMVATVYNAKAASSASALAGMKPGISDASSAPALLDAAKATATAGPTTIQNTATYLSALTDFLSKNNIPTPSQSVCQDLAQKTDPDAKSAGTKF